MDSTTTRRFREALKTLPAEVQDRARDAYDMFQQDSNHPGLRFKRVHPTLPVYSARVTLDYRAVGIVENDCVVWFWIGSHSDYEKLFRRSSHYLNLNFSYVQVDALGTVKRHTLAS